MACSQAPKDERPLLGASGECAPAIVRPPRKRPALDIDQLEDAASGSAQAAQDPALLSCLHANCSVQSFEEECYWPSVLPPPTVMQHEGLRVILRHYQPLLVQNISVSALLPYLNRHLLLTHHENELLLSKAMTNYQKVLELLLLIERKGISHMWKLFQAIFEEPDHTGHKEIIRVLEPVLNRLPQSVGQYTIQEGGIAVEPLVRGQLSALEDFPSNPVHESTSERQSTSQNYPDEPELPILDYDLAPPNQLRHACVERDLAYSASAGDEGPSSTQSSEPEVKRLLWSGATAPTLSDPSTQLDSAPCISASYEGPSTSKHSNPEITKMLQAVRQDTEMMDASMIQLVRAPGRVYPTGPLLKESHRYIYSKLFHMAWNGQDQQALSIVRALRRSPQVSIDLKVVSMEVVHTVNNDRDLKMLGSALAFTDRTECENKLILKCRIHRRIAGLHYRNGDVDEARDHLDTALQLTSQISPDIDSVYTLRLKALMLFDEYKETGDEQIRKDSEKLFRQAMEHARLQPEWKRPVTERIKISKALFHLDMIDEYKKRNKSEDAIEQLEIRAREALDDVNGAFLTDGDKAFLYLTSAQLCQLWGDNYGH